MISDIKKKKTLFWQLIKWNRKNNLFKIFTLCIHNIGLFKKSIKIDFYQLTQFHWISLRILIYGSLSILRNFLKIPPFWENWEKLFLMHLWQFFGERRRIEAKTNITFFFITNEILTTLLLRSFFQRSCIFCENSKTSFWGKSFFWRDRNNLFYGKWVFKYFFI